MSAVLALVGRFWWILLIVAIGVGGYVFRDHLTGSAGDLRVGDCIDLPARSDSISEVQHRPCADPHDAEVFAVLTHPAPNGAPVLTQTETNSYLEQNCLSAFDLYTGQDFRTEPDHDIGWFYPTASSWAEGNRTFTCYLARLDQAKMTGSRRVAGSTGSP